MGEPDPARAPKLRQALAQLELRLLNHPDVSLIDVGYAGDAAPGAQLALRIHVRASWARTPPAQRAAFPEQIDGIPVIVIAGDYRPDDDGGRPSG